MNPAYQSSDIQAGGGSSIMVGGTLYWTLQKLLVKLVLAGVTYICHLNLKQYKHKILIRFYILFV